MAPSKFGTIAKSDAGAKVDMHQPSRAGALRASSGLRTEDEPASLVKHALLETHEFRVQREASRDHFW